VELALVLISGCMSFDTFNTLAVDMDGNGFSYLDGDCDGSLVDDQDCDGLRSGEECDDYNPASMVRTALDADCDGLPRDEDCDDNNANSLVRRSEDGDCDGVPTVADCSENKGVITLEASGVDFVTVCAQNLDIGCTPGQSSCDGDESPVMSVSLTHDFYVSTTEVTQAQFRAAMGYDPSTRCGGDCPVENLSWHEAAAYANALSRAARLELCYRCTGSDASISCRESGDPYGCDGYRLLTESEWEAAARCEQDLRYAGSDSVNEVAWHEDNSGGGTRTVARRAENDCGLYDLSGNVWEWTHDWYGYAYYSRFGRTNPIGPSSGDARVVRGGSAISSAQRTRVSNRDSADPNGRNAFVGFRVARTAR